MKRFALLCTVLTMGSLANAQTANPAPTTKLDTFLSQTGVLTIRESLGTESFSSPRGGITTLEAVRLYSPGQENQAIQGIRVAVKSSSHDNESSKFIEQEEVRGIIDTLKYMETTYSKLDSNLQPEIEYNSKSNFTLGVFYSSPTSVFFTQASIDDVFYDIDSIQSFEQGLIRLQHLLK